MAHGAADDNVSLADKLKLLRLVMAMEGFTVVGAGIAVITSNSVTFLANVLIAVSGLLGTWLSYRTVRKIAAGPNERYSYGLGRLETLSSLAVAASMAFSALFILYDTIGRIYFPEPVEGGGIGLFVTAITLVGSGYLWWRNWRLARTEGSPIFGAVWRLCRQGTLEDLLILVTVGLGLLLGREAEWSHYLDPAGSLILLVLLVMSIYELLRGSVGDLLDWSLSEYHQMLIMRSLAGHYDAFDQVHGIHTRRSGSQVFIELSLEFDPSRSMGEVYAAMAAIRGHLAGQIPGARIVIAPMPPC